MADNEGQAQRPGDPLRSRATVRYDDGCRLCRAAVRFAAARDRQQHFTFVPLPDPTASPGPGTPDGDQDTILLDDPCGNHVRSEAVLRVAAGLGGPWSALGVLRVIPRPIRDAVYRYVARHRRRWFGRT